MDKFPDKDPGEVLDYSFHFAELLDDTLELDTSAVVVESCDPAEDVFALTVSNVSRQESDTVGIQDTVVFWLTGGTEGTKYVLKATVSDDQNAPEDRTFVRRASIKIKKR